MRPSQTALEFPGGSASKVEGPAFVTPVAWVLSQGLPHAMQGQKKKKKRMQTDPLKFVFPVQS